LMMVVTLGVVLCIGGIAGDPSALAAVLFVHNVFGALQDVSVDGLAVDVLPEEERGRVYGLANAASFLGMSIGGAGFLILAGGTDIELILVLQLAVLLGFILFPLLIRERPSDRILRPRRRAGGAPKKGTRLPFYAGARYPLFSFVREPVVLFTSSLGLLYFFVGYVLAVVLPVLLVGELGWTEAEFGALRGGVAPWVGAAGAVAGGWVVDSVGPKRVLIAASVALCLTWGSFALCDGLWGARGVVWTMVVVESLISGCALVAFIALAMRASSSRASASSFAVFMALVNLSQVAASSLAGTILSALGFWGVYLAGGAVELLLVLLILTMGPRQSRENRAAVGT